jgi:hypothetical protein
MEGKIITTKLHKIENSILGVQNNPEIQGKLNPFGYTSEHISEGKTLLDKVTGLMTTWVEGYSDQFIASDKVGKLWQTAYSHYMIIVKVLRVIFVGEPEILKRFNATGPRNRSLSGWLRNTRILYDNVLKSPNTLAVLTNYGYSFERINNELRDVNEVENLHSKHLSEKGEAQQSTIERDKAFDELCKWFS